MHSIRTRISIASVLLIICLLLGFYIVAHPSATAWIAEDTDLGTTGTALHWKPRVPGDVVFTRRRILPVQINPDGLVPMVQDITVMSRDHYFDPWGQIGDCYWMQDAADRTPRFIGCRFP